MLNPPKHTLYSIVNLGLSKREAKLFPSEKGVKQSLMGHSNYLMRSLICSPGFLPILSLVPN
jgi:hypothetical protein